MLLKISKGQEDVECHDIIRHEWTRHIQEEKSIVNFYELFAIGEYVQVVYRFASFVFNH